MEKELRLKAIGHIYQCKSRNLNLGVKLNFPVYIKSEQTIIEKKKIVQSLLILRLCVTSFFTDLHNPQNEQSCVDYHDWSLRNYRKYPRIGRIFFFKKLT